MDTTEITQAYLSTEDVKNKLEKLQGVCAEVRSFHAKLNELTEDQNTAALAAMQESLEEGFASGLDFGLAAGIELERRVSSRKTATLLTIRTFFAAALMVPASVLTIKYVSDQTYVLLVSCSMVTLAFLIFDKIFNWGMVRLSSKKKDQTNVVSP